MNKEKEQEKRIANFAKWILSHNPKIISLTLIANSRRIVTRNKRYKNVLYTKGMTFINKKKKVKV